MIAARVVVKFNNFGRVSARVRSELPAVVGAVTKDVETRVKGYAPVDTGALRDGIHGTHTGLTGVVSSGVDYDPYLEYGTSRAPAQPHFRPGAEAAKPGLEAAIRSLLGGLA